MIKKLAYEKKIDDLKEGNITCVENVKNFLSQIEKNNKKYNIFLEINKNAIDIAKKLDEKRENNQKLGKLFGLVYSVKSNISVKDFKISCASKTLENYKGTFNADVIEKLDLEDAIFIGIVNNDEFACGGSGETSAFLKTINPVLPNRVPGGSSSASAACISSDMSDFSLGSDTGGSIRNPASHCGVVGIKPSYGRVSRYGLADLSMSLDQIGPFSKSIKICELVLQIISGHSLNDATTTQNKVFDLCDLKLDKKYNIGIIKNFEDFIEDKRILNILEEKIKILKDLGHNIVELDIKYIDLSIQAYYPIVYTEFYSATRKLDGVKYGNKIEDFCGEEVLRRILGGKEISKSEYGGAYYKKSLKVKEIIELEFEKAFEKVDFIISCVTPMLPHEFKTKLTPKQMYSYDAFTIPANLSGICAGVLSVDKVIEKNEEIFVGTQVMANKFKENLLFEGLYLLNKISPIKK